MADPSIQEFVSKMPAAFVPEKAAGVEARIQLKLTGSQPGDWHITIKDGECKAGEGSLPAPDLTLTADADDFIKVFTGKMDGMQAFMQGKLKLAGDLSVAMKLMSLFKLK